MRRRKQEDDRSDRLKLWKVEILEAIYPESERRHESKGGEI
jgi:hypothetical protein